MAEDANHALGDVVKAGSRLIGKVAGAIKDLFD